MYLIIALKIKSEDGIAQFEAVTSTARSLAELSRDETHICGRFILENVKVSFQEALKDSKP